jgi:general secretion pathway protein M
MSTTAGENGGALGWVRNAWAALAMRERRLVSAAGWLLAGALLWWLALAPALGTLRAAERQHQVLDAQLQSMLALKAQAVSLQSQVRASGEDSRRVLVASVKQAFGSSASLQFAGERASVTLKNVSGQTLASWLMDVRVNALVLPAEVRLTRLPAPAGTDSWDATLVLNLPSL